MIARSLSKSSVFALLVSSLASAGAAEELPARAGADRDARWIPGLAIVAGALRLEREGEVESTEFGFVDGASAAVSGFLGLSAELSTPALTKQLGAPRLFVHGDLTFGFDNDEGLANQGNPGPPIVPPIANFPALGVPNLGSAVRVQTEPLMLSAGAGISFGLRAWERSIRIKPSLEWTWQEDKVRSLFSSAEGEGANPDFCTPCRTVFIDASSVEGYHSLGPGLEIEVEAARVRDVVLTLFGGSQVFRVLGDTRLRETHTGIWQTNGTPSLGRAPTLLRSEYERDPWHYRFSVGLRLLWLPEAAARP